MSSSYSALIDYGSVKPYQPDFQLISTALQAKQTKLDTNRAKLQSYRDQLGVIDLAKDSDGEYLDMKLQQVTDISNQYANGDLSNDNLANSLISNMGQVLDANVKNAIIGTKILRNEQAEWSEIKKKDPKLYSETNYAFAMQRANSWLNDGQTGTTYNGGGSFIEYASPTEQINKAMPELLKAATHKRQRAIAGPVGGIGGIITEEYVDRNELQNMIQSQLGEKHLKQMQIDAWAKYDNLPDTALQNDYEVFSQSKIQENKEKIASLEAAVANASNPDVKQQYQDSLDYAKQEKNSFETDKSFEGMMASRGRSGTYTTLHQEQLLDGYLDAYSREPITVDIAVNTIDQANRTLEHQNEVFAETKAQNRMSNQLRQDANEIAAYKAGVKPDGTVDTAATFLPGQKVDIKPATTEGSVFTKLNEDAQGLKTTAKAALIQMGVSQKTANYFVTTKRFADMVVNGNLAGIKTLELDGKKLQVSKDFRNAVTHLGADHFNNPILTDAYKEIDDMVGDAQATLAAGVVSKELSLSSIPNYTVKINQVGSKYVVAKAENGFFENGKMVNKYAELLKKKATLKKGQSLSKVDEINLQLYGNMHLMNDGGLSIEQRAFARQRVVQQLNELELSTKEYGKIEIKSKIQHGETIPNTTTKVEWGKDSWMTEITKKNIQPISTTAWKTVKGIFAISDAQQIAEIENALTYAKKEGDKNLINQLTKNIEELQKKESTYGIDVSDRIMEGFKSIEDNISRATASQSKLVAGREQVLPRKGNEATYVKLAAASGLVTTSKDDLVLIPQFDTEGKPTTKVNVKNLTTGVIGKTSVRLDKEMSSEELEKLSIAKWDIKGHRYNAEKGVTAPILKLGNGNYNGDMDRGIDPIRRATLLGQVEDLPQEVLAETNKRLKEYASGIYEVQYIPVGKKYRPIVINTATKKEALPGFMGDALNSPIIEDSKADEMLEDPKSYVDSIIQDMITAAQRNVLSNL